LLEQQIDLRFVGQESQLPISLPEALDEEMLGHLRESFLRAYRAIYQYASGDAVETVNIRVIARGVRRNRLAFDALDLSGEECAAGTHERGVHFNGDQEATPTLVLDRWSFKGSHLGPLILESLDSTIVVPPDWKAEPDECGNVVATWQE
jgi:N-methylhydantoinase A